MTTLGQRVAHSLGSVIDMPGVWTRKEYAEMDAYYEAEEARGELAGSPDKLPCWTCSNNQVGFRPFADEPLEREVTGLGPVVEPRDPTQTYRLACGHLTIG